MTRSDFIENVTSWWDLIDFCNDEDCSICEDVYDDGQKNDYINELLSDWACEYDWEGLYSKLDEIPTGYDYYRLDEYGDFEYLDDSDFDNYKDEVLEWMDDGDWWDEEPADADEDEDIFAEELAAERPDTGETAAEEEDFSVGDLLSMCGMALFAFQQERDSLSQELDDSLSRLIGADIPKPIS